MGDVWIGVVGALVGVVVGWGGNLLAQRIAYDRESSERLTGVRRRAYLDWLAAVHGLYDAVDTSHRALRARELEHDAAVSKLRGQQTGDVQSRLEELRFVSGDLVAARAAALWRHLRRERVPLGQDMAETSWRTWRKRYWDLRREFVDAARVETGLAPLDWDTAGIGNVRF